jgi:competence protein ComEC
VIWIPCARFFAITLAAWVGSAPFIAYYFNIVSPISLLSNIAVVLLAFCMVATGFIAAVASLLSDWLVVTLNNANLFFGLCMIRIVEALSEIPRGYFCVKPPTVWMMALYYCALLALMTGWMFKNRTRMAATASVFCGVLGLMMWKSLPQHRPLTVTFLDVGSGSAVFVDLPGSQNDVLIDAGREAAARQIIAPFLRRNGLAEVPRLFITQWDVNHSGGLAGLLPQVRIREIVESGWRNPSGRTQRQMLELARREGIPLKRAVAGDVFHLGDSAEIRVLHPPGAISFKSFDDNSLVLHVRLGETRILLMSDAGESVEKLLLSSDVDLKSDILCLGAHYKETMGMSEFLERVGAHTVILNRGEPWGGKGAPSELLDRLAQRNTTVFDTANHGAIVVRVKNNRVDIKSVLSPR